MKQYELLVVFKPNADSEEVDKLIEKVSADAEALNGKTDSVEKIGRKKLAYEIQNFRDGFFANMIMSLPADKIAEFKLLFAYVNVLYNECKKCIELIDSKPTIIKDNKILYVIEYDGSQHFEESLWDLQKIQRRDLIKNKFYSFTKK